jgi:hypothetical protein
MTGARPSHSFRQNDSETYRLSPGPKIEPGTPAARGSFPQHLINVGISEGYLVLHTRFNGSRELFAV